MTHATDTVKALFNAYVIKDRAAAERLLADDFRFTSPLDNRIDRDTYFRICWPNSEAAEGFDFIHLAGVGDRVFITYEGKSAGQRFRNTEIHTLRGNKIVEVEVYFGWDVPHEIPSGEHRDPPKNAAG